MEKEQDKKVKIVRTTLDELPYGKPEDWPSPDEKFKKSPIPQGVSHSELYKDIIIELSKLDIPENDEEKEWLEKQNFHNFAEDAYIG